MPVYNRAAKNAIRVGKEIGKKFVKDFLINRNQMGQDPKLIHAIGHSLGAHLVGYIGKANSKPKIGRITGLDPARPYFKKLKRNEQLHYNDAEFVDVIHTNSGRFLFI